MTSIIGSSGGSKTTLLRCISLTAGGRKTITSETDYLLSDVYAMADFVYKPGDLGAAIASGSFLVDGMLVGPLQRQDPLGHRQQL